MRSISMIDRSFHFWSIETIESIENFDDRDRDQLITNWRSNGNTDQNRCELLQKIQFSAWIVVKISVFLKRHWRSAIFFTFSNHIKVIFQFFAILQKLKISIWFPFTEINIMTLLTLIDWIYKGQNQLQMRIQCKNMALVCSSQHSKCTSVWIHFEEYLASHSRTQTFSMKPWLNRHLLQTTNGLSFTGLAFWVRKKFKYQ